MPFVEMEVLVMLFGGHYKSSLWQYCKIVFYWNQVYSKLAHAEYRNVAIYYKDYKHLSLQVFIRS